VGYRHKKPAGSQQATDLQKRQQLAAASIGQTEFVSGLGLAAAKTLSRGLALASDQRLAGWTEL
jgi:hypothetical protein